MGEPLLALLAPLLVTRIGNLVVLVIFMVPAARPGQAQSFRRNSDESILS